MDIDSDFLQWVAAASCFMLDAASGGTFLKKKPLDKKPAEAWDNWGDSRDTSSTEFGANYPY